MGTIENRRSHKSMPIPTTKEVISPANAGLSLINREFSNIIKKAMMISQLPTVNPTLSCNPTNSASKGDTPKSALIMQVIPMLNSSIPNKNGATVRFNVFLLNSLVISICKVKIPPEHIHDLIIVNDIINVVNTTFLSVCLMYKMVRA
ncbi:hypothetical protein [Paenibacillus pabuli]|uniref:hypothetical protein n=1 Tax=Paenibacillus pabuli TaxID=1472 RepID=UPI003CF37F3E